MRHLCAISLVTLAWACGQPSSDQSPPAAQQESPAGQNPASAPAAGPTPASGLTVLLPADIARAESTAPLGVDVRGSHYTLSRREDGELSFTLAGSVANREESSGIDAGPGPPATTIRGVPVYVSENEGIKTATWIEKGTAFALDIECRTDSDQRCTSPNYILDRVRELVERPAQ